MPDRPDNPMDWNELIGEVVEGRWVSPETGKSAKLPFDTIVLAEDLDGREAELVAPLKLGSRLAVVSDEHTVEAMGRRVAKALRSIATVDEIVLPPEFDADEAIVERIHQLTRHADGLIAVGSGALSDSCKYATFKDGRRYATFGTAASMNGYAASTASITLASGLKTSLPAHAPRGIFLDLKVSASAPRWLAAAGLGDSLCRPTAQVDWWASHRLFGTYYSNTPYILQERDEPRMIDSAPGLARGEVASVGWLHRVLTLCGLGIAFTGVSHHGSMGEHSISHYIDMFAGDRHPGTTHGQQVGVASLAMARLQHRLLALDTPPEVKPTMIDEPAMLKRYGPGIGPRCIDEFRRKALDGAGTENLNAKLKVMWPELCGQLRAMLLPVKAMESALRAAGGPTTAAELGLDLDIWREALLYAREIRNRWSFLDLAADAGLLEDFVNQESR